MRPVIGITSGMGLGAPTKSQAPPQEMQQLGDTYILAIEKAGGIPVILPVYDDISLVREVASGLDGVLLSGGSDIDTNLFGARPSGKVRPVIPRRDTFDFALADYVVNETNIPLLGICRGIQVMNVVRGGKLHVDLMDDGKQDHQLTMYPRTLGSHDISIFPGSILADIIGSDVIRVNSFHHQAVSILGEGYICSAVSVPDDVIEAIELPGSRFVMGLQWHPEGMIYDKPQQEIFRRFIAAAESYRKECHA